MAINIIQDFLLQNRFSVRTNSGNGLWVLFLLPLALIASLIRHPIILTPTYKVLTVASFTLFYNSLYVVINSRKNEKLKILSWWSFIIAISTGCLYNLCLHKGWIFSLSSGLFVTLTFLMTYKFLLQNLKESFTLGEAGFISQGFVLFIFSIIINLIAMIESKNLPKSNMQISTIIIQMGLLGILLLAYTVHKLEIKSTRGFYLTMFLMLSFVTIIPLHVILQQSPVLWIFNQILLDIPLLKMFIYWSFCIALAVLAISNQIFYAKRASTATRKIFHILAVLVYLPGLYYRCSFLYLASGVVLGIFFTLEMVRLLSIPPLGMQLQDGYMVFRDEKDTGILALTPIYLLVGVSMPIWIHPAPCDVTDSAQFTILPLLSGLLSIGIGDTAASYIGSNFGKLKWKGTNKTVEGTVACILSQYGFIYLLYYIGCLPYLDIGDIVRIGLAVLVSSVVEAKTSQIDNLVLPLVMYLILI